MGNAELSGVGANFAPGRTKLRDRHAWNSTTERRWPTTESASRISTFTPRILWFS
jgi:hypothetical protein